MSKELNSENPKARYVSVSKSLWRLVVNSEPAPRSSTLRDSRDTDSRICCRQRPTKNCHGNPERDLKKPDKSYKSIAVGLNLILNDRYRK